MDVYHFMYPYMIEAEKICRPFLSHYNLNHFWYARFYSDGSFIDLGVDPACLQYMLENKYFNFFDTKELFCPNLWLPQERTVVTTPLCLSSILDPENVKIMTEKHNATYFFNIFINRRDYLESFGFSASTENYESLMLYLRHFGILKAFGIDFRERAAPLIKEIELELRGKNFAPFSQVDEQRRANIFSKNTNNNAQNAWTEKNLKHFFLLTPTGNVQISPRERQCLSLSTLGNSAKEIAKIMGVSYRTVETFLEKVKEKTGLRTRSALLKAFIESGLS